MAEKSKKFNKTLILGPVRMAFPALFDPEETDNGERYKMVALFPPDYDLNPLRDAMEDAMYAGFGEERDWPKGRNDVLPDDKLYPADTKNYTGFKPGWHAMSVSSKDAPGIVDADRNEVLSKREVYGGRWCRIQVNVTYYNDKSKGVGVYLNHVQLLENDEAFSGKGNAADAFDKYELKDKSNGERRENSNRETRGRGEENSRRSERDADGGEERGGRGREESRSREEGRDRRGSRDEGREENSRRSRREENEEEKDDRPNTRRADRDREEDRGSSRGSRDEGRDRDRRSKSRDADDEWN